MMRSTSQTTSQRILEALPIGLFVIDQQCNVIFANQRAREILQKIAAKEASRLNVRGLFGNNSPFDYVIQKVFQEGKAIRGFRMSLRQSEGNVPVEVHISKLPAEAADGTIKAGKAGGGDRAIVMFDDVTGRLELERRMAEAERLAAIGELAAGAAHEIRNPLTAVKGFAQLLEHRLQGEEPWSTYAGIIEKEIAHIDEILRDLLLLSRPRQSSLEYTNLNDLAEEALVLWGYHATSRGMNLVLKLERDVPLVVVDRAEIRQVLNNLITNALDASKSGGVVEIGTRWNPDDRMVEISVGDTGDGIDANSLAKIFNPFFTTKEKGTGLGLSVAYSIVESYGGAIEVESAAGKGTTFRVLLPVPMACAVSANTGGSARYDE
ncbi:MAG TPA: PAS domain-containing protein [Clostridia bacterium]|nr:PAS domain-containing protein [Clostridia bacterium]